jgi:NADH-quinone oxidoreductase subunit F
MDFDSLAAIGSMLGSAGVMVMNEETCMVDALHVIARFYAHESCGQCTACREGTGWMERILHRVLQGQGRRSDPALLLDIANNTLGNTICPLGDAAALPVISFISKFREEFEFHVREKRCHLEVPARALSAVA